MQKNGYHLSDLVYMALSPGDIAITSGGFHRCTPAWNDASGQVLDVCRIYFPVAGSATVSLGDHTTALRSGRGYFIPGGLPHRHRCAKHMDVHWLHFSPTSVELRLLLARVTQVVALSRAEVMYWKPTAEALAAHFEGADAALTCRVHAMVMAVVGDVLAHAVDEAARREVAAHLGELGSAIAYMDEHFRTNPSLETLADVAHRSASWFHKRFRQVTGMTPHAYMLARRMQLAQQLLMTVDMRVGDAAHEAGYDNVFYFSRVYRQYFGRNAMEDRKRAEPRP